MTKQVSHADVFAYPIGYKSYEVVAMINGHRVARYYYDYTKRQAIQSFYNEMNGK